MRSLTKAQANPKRATMALQQHEAFQKAASTNSIILFGFGIILTTLLFVFFGSHGWWTFFGFPVLGFVVGAALAEVFSELPEAKARKQAAEDYLEKHVKSHRVALMRNLSRAVKLDDYGKIVKDRREDVATEFMTSIEIPLNLIRPDTALKLVERTLRLETTANRKGKFDATMVPVDGVAFEHWVADALGRFGWVASVTKGSGDQGVDVIASKNGISVGIQCKLYSQSVGNKAVQEAISGKVYHGLTKAAVLSNAKFTQSAQDLAASADIILMSNLDLVDPDAVMLAAHERPRSQPARPTESRLEPQHSTINQNDKPSKRPPSPFRYVRH